MKPSPSQNEQVSNEATGMPSSSHSVHTFPRPEQMGQSLKKAAKDGGMV
ncbi:hypothetical protein [Acaryochloris sp. CCMEE 5410]|nr:hypothetical protein [Acaryochloris sp. CCMEE 5410]KAI9132677.1 hypothetical protein ON05_004450 [Acaryochloris sp. CCMEE 5410]